MNVLVTGGAGYIGSHMVLVLLEAGHNVVVLDNLSNSSAESLCRVAEIAGRSARFFKGDIRDSLLLDNIFSAECFDAVIHFAGLKSVAESSLNPLCYYDNNVVGTLRLIQAMNRAGVKKLVFSSSATVYGDPEIVPVPEDARLSAANPYGTSKLHIEIMLRDVCRSDHEWGIAILRYFNPAGAHPSGRIGEDPKGTPNNLMPYIAQVAIGRRPYLSVYGDDYETLDGTGVRDYIHVMDLVEGHLAALNALAPNKVITCNLGTGMGYSVLQIIEAFSKASGLNIPWKVSSRRAGDVGCYYADPTRARDFLGWVAVRGIDEMCRDHWRWQQMNPDGYHD